MRGRKRHRKKKQTIRLKLKHVKIVVRKRKLNVNWSLDPTFELSAFAWPLLSTTLVEDESK